MVLYFYKTGELNGSNYVNFSLRSNGILIIENDDKYCFLCSKLAYIRPCNNNHPSRISNYRKYFNELSIEGFDFTKGFKCSDVHKLENLNNLSINIFELNFYQDQNEWRDKLIPTKASKNDSDRVVHPLIYKNHYVLNKKLNVFLGFHNKNLICGRCLNSYTSENMLMLLERKCGDDIIATIRTSSGSHIYWKKQFY